MGSGSPITLHSGPLCRKSTFTCRSHHTLQSALSPGPWNGDLSPQSHSSQARLRGRSPRSSPDDATSARLDAKILCPCLVAGPGQGGTGSSGLGSLVAAGPAGIDCWFLFIEHRRWTLHFAKPKRHSAAATRY